MTQINKQLVTTWLELIYETKTHCKHQMWNVNSVDILGLLMVAAGVDYCKVETWELWLDEDNPIVQQTGLGFEQLDHIVYLNDTCDTLREAHIYLTEFYGNV
jgi:hypothetical protein